MSVAAAPQRIRKLPDELINRIAAGEVIERPASVVKELLENSLDAGASDVTVTVKAGGTRLIRVKDNGYGIRKADMILAVDRHTTSKLTKASDLLQINTLGFRGEALSSIASVSRFSLTSGCAAEAHAWQLTNAGGPPRLQPAAHPTGTTIEVCDLFYNVPARRKFLRTDKTELLHIQEIIRRIALSRRALSVRFIHNNRQVFHIPAAAKEPATRVAAIFGQSFIHAARPVAYQAASLHLYGWVGTTAQARSQTDRQYFYLNGRAIRDKQVSHAVRQAYQEKLYPGRQPVYILYLEMEAGGVDVNVHPGKQEVRFRRPRDVHDFIYAALKQALASAEPVQSGAVLSTETHAGNDMDLASAVREDRFDHVFSNQLPVEQGRQQDKQFLVLDDSKLLLQATSDGVVLVDLPRARELQLFARLKTAIMSGTLQRRPLLVPVTFTVSTEEADWVADSGRLLRKVGLLVDHMAPDTLLLRELPVLLANADAVSLVRDVVKYCVSHTGPKFTDSALLDVLARHVNDTWPAHWAPSELDNLLGELESVEEHVFREKVSAAIRRISVCELREQLARGR